MTVKEIVEKKNDLIMKLAFTPDGKEVKELWKKIVTLENKIRFMTMN